MPTPESTISSCRPPCTVTVADSTIGLVGGEYMAALSSSSATRWISSPATVPAIEAPPTRLARAFSTVFGIAPHAYVLGRRLEAARDRILRGQSLADVAAEVGFHVQAHLSRQFGRFIGTSPGRYRAAGRQP